MRPICCPATSSRNRSRGAMSRCTLCTSRGRSRTSGINLWKAWPHRPIARPSKYSASIARRLSRLEIGKEVGAGPQLRNQPVPSIHVGGMLRETRMAAVDGRKLDFDAVQHNHVFRLALGEPAVIGEQQSTLHRDVAYQRLDCRDAVVERRLRIVESKSPAAPHDRPIAHLIAAEDQSSHPPGVEHEYAAGREKNM